jgi:hypothetical protein
MCGFGIDTSVASFEEVSNAMQNQKPQRQKLDSGLLAEAEDLNIELPKVATYLKKSVEDLTNEDLRQCIETKRKALAK